MRKVCSYYLVTFFLLSICVYADNLYLLEIDGFHQLEVTIAHVDHAHGTIEGKFIVSIDAQQREILQMAGIELEFLVQNCRLNNYYLIIKGHHQSSKTAISITSVYTSGREQVAELDESSLGILEREGYMVFRLSEKSTPFFYNPPQVPTRALAYYPTDTLAGLVNQDSLYNYDTRMEAFYTRFTPSDSCLRARDWIRNKFIEFGYSDIHYQNFPAYQGWMEVYDVPAYNVICNKEGTEFPDSWIIIGAHYDSYSSNEIYSPAPGADDNASGISAVLELARIFKNHDFRYSLMFVAFGAEEQGCDGSDFLAEQLFSDSVDIELMVNFDVISYESDDIPDIVISITNRGAYGQVFLDAADRLTDLVPDPTSGALPSDDHSFADRGYYTVTPSEANLHPDMHTPYDLSSTIDFTLMRKIIEMSAASIPIIDICPGPVECKVYDIGDGQSLRVVWDSCFEDYTYQVLYSIYDNYITDTVEIAPFNYQCDISGLTESQEYYFAVKNITAEGYPSLYLIISSGVPYLQPRVPTGFMAESDSALVKLQWSANTELDFDHYKLLRREIEGDWSVIQGDLTDTVYYDTDQDSAQEYQYILVAVDSDMNESDSTIIVEAGPAFFDQGVLLVDETQDGGSNPTIFEQNIFFENMFGDVPFDRVPIETMDDTLKRFKGGQYNPVFWVDDDDCCHFLEPSIDFLEWYFGFHTDFFLAGWKTIYNVTGQSYFYPGNFYYDEFGISYINFNPIYDFTGATGIDGWPDLELKPESPDGGRLPDIEIFTETPEAEVIYTYNSASANPFFGNKPVGIALDTYHGKRVVLGFPLYYLTDESAQALIAKVFEYFSEESVLHGDANGDWALNILDITHLINYLYKGGPVPVDMNNADPNASCTVNILDVTYLIGYLYKGGPEPLAGCVY